jgi:hypothetical protein
MLIPVVGGIAAYYERFNLLQASGVVLLAGGIVLMPIFMSKNV